MNACMICHRSAAPQNHCQICKVYVCEICNVKEDHTGSFTCSGCHREYCKTYLQDKTAMQCWKCNTCQMLNNLHHGSRPADAVLNHSKMGAMIKQEFNKM
jgi:hypothetical protein